MLISDMIRVFWLVGLDFFSLTGLTQPSKVRIWCCKKQTQSNKWIDFDWLYLVWLDSFCLAFLCLMTQQDFEILWMSRLRLVETEIFLGCRDRDSSRLRNFSDVETETHRDWENQWMSRPRPVETGQKMSIPRLHRDSRWSLAQNSRYLHCRDIHSKKGRGVGEGVYSFYKHSKT